MISYNLDCLEKGLNALLVGEVRWDSGEGNISKRPNPRQCFQDILLDDLLLAASRSVSQSVSQLVSYVLREMTYSQVVPLYLP